jgi:dethiobiotin synthetase
MMSGLLVTGTDTGVGKTVVACALAAALVERGLRTTVWKPVETGWDASAEDASDAARLRRAVGSAEPLEAICPYRLRAPLAPAVAARLEGIAIDVGHLARLYCARVASADIVVVEGAGGLLVPLTETTTYAELADDLGIPILIVGANRLGVINHVALTARVATAAGLHVIGFVLNTPHIMPAAVVTSPAPPAGGAGTRTARTPNGGVPGSSPRQSPAQIDPSRATNQLSIEQLTGLACLGEVPYEPRALDAPECVATHLDVPAILAAATRAE